MNELKNKKEYRTLGSSEKSSQKIVALIAKNMHITTFELADIF